MDFQQTENRFKQLKAQFEAGTLTEDKFKSQLEELMVRDDTGSWWMLGYETERWYRHNGKEWIQTDLKSGHVEQLVSAPKWTALFWIIVAWSIAWAVGTAIFEIIFPDISLLSLAGAISGALGGFITAISLRNENVLSNWKDVLWITLAWMMGSAIGWATAMAITLGIGGLVLAVILRNQNKLSDWNAALVIALAWTIGSAFGAGVHLPMAGISGRILSDAIGGAIGAAIGGFVTVWQIRESSKSK